MEELINNLEEEINLTPQDEDDMNLQPELGKWASWREKRKLNSIARKVGRKLAKQNKIERKQNGQVIGTEIVGDYAWSVLQGIITIGAIAIALTTPFTGIAFLAGIFTTISEFAFITNIMDTVKKHKEYRKEHPKKNKVKEEKKKEKKVKKLGLFKGLTQKFTNKFRKAKNDDDTLDVDIMETTDNEPSNVIEDTEDIIDVTPTEAEKDTEDIIDITPAEVVEEKPILKTKLTREQKIGQVRDLGILHNAKYGIYCIPVPKEDKKLQKFIGEEYRKEYPGAKVQSFETDETKMLVLRNEPIMFKK